MSPLRPPFPQQNSPTNAHHRFVSLLFSTTSALLFSQVLCFDKHLRCPIVFSPRQKFLNSEGCTKPEKRHFVTPLFATLTHSCSRKSFPCHSYENNRDRGDFRLCESQCFLRLCVILCQMGRPRHPAGNPAVGAEPDRSSGRRDRANHESAANAKVTPNYDERDSPLV